MRFAWLRNNTESDETPEMTGTDRLLLVGYNFVWWIPVFLPILGIVSYRAGTLGFLLITVIRAAINVYRNNILTLDRAARFPLRIP